MKQGKHEFLKLPGRLVMSSLVEMDPEMYVISWGVGAGREVLTPGSELLLCSSLQKRPIRLHSQKPSPE